jgi:hypothetical protein
MIDFELVKHYKDSHSQLAESGSTVEHKRVARRLPSGIADGARAGPQGLPGIFGDREIPANGPLSRVQPTST